jgi:hypothetical protein
MPRKLSLILTMPCSLLLCAHLSAAEDPRDFSGVWQAFATSPPLAANAVPELNADGEVLVADFSARYPNAVDPVAYCVPRGVPDMMATPGAVIEIVQAFSRVTLLGADGQVRRVFLDDRPFPETRVATSAGYGIGHWENDTLVAETRFLDTLLSGRWPRTQEMTVAERMTKLRRGQVTAPVDSTVANSAVDDAVLEVALTFTDPALYRKPQTVTVYYQHLADDALPAPTCAAELWRQALDAANP